ncbi:MAG: cobaltochelatase subunit CobT, partial [Gammaproteobacteria bacterium]|nr:cobaltochelatase subunit CobT [Gammaproteobacteria bacterium]
RRDRRESAPLLEIINLLAREAMTGSAPPPSAAGVLALWRPRLWPRIGVHLTQMAAALPDPHAFTRITLALLTTLDLSIEADEEGEMQCSLEGYRRVTDGSEEDVGVEQGKGGSKSPPASEEVPDTEERSAESLPDDGEDEIASTADGQGVQKKELAPTSSESHGPSQPYFESNGKSYQAWDRQFDQIVEAQALCSDEELSQLRSDLDQLLGPMRSLVGRLANRLQRQLQARLFHGWVFDQEEGLLDTARLARVVTDPTHPLSFKREREMPFRDTVVTLLIDNSGSMRGQP